MGRLVARRSSRHLIDSFGSPSALLPTLYGSLRFFLTEADLCRVTHLFPYAVVSFEFVVSVLTAPVTHQALDLQNNESSSPLRPLSAFADPENLRFQAARPQCPCVFQNSLAGPFQPPKCKSKAKISLFLFKLTYKISDLSWSDPRPNSPQALPHPPFFSPLFKRGFFFSSNCIYASLSPPFSKSDFEFLSRAISAPKIPV